MTKSDIIIPLAALVGAPLCDIKPKEAKEVNLDSMFLLKSILSKNQRVILPVSNSDMELENLVNFALKSRHLIQYPYMDKPKFNQRVLLWKEKIQFRLG